MTHQTDKHRGIHNFQILLQTDGLFLQDILLADVHQVYRHAVTIKTSWSSTHQIINVHDLRQVQESETNENLEVQHNSYFFGYAWMPHCIFLRLSQYINSIVFLHELLVLGCVSRQTVKPQLVFNST